MEVIKKGVTFQQYELDKIKSFVSKYNIGLYQYKLLLEMHDGGQPVLFDIAGAFVSPNQWHEFWEKLARLSDRECRIEVWIHDWNGKLKLLPKEKWITTSKLAFLFIPLVISFAGAIAFNINPSVNSFIAFGIATIILNSFYILFIYLKNKEENQNQADIIIVSAGYVAYMLITFISVYLISVFLVWAIYHGI